MKYDQLPAAELLIYPLPGDDPEPRYRGYLGRAEVDVVCEAEESCLLANYWKGLM